MTTTATTPAPTTCRRCGRKLTASVGIGPTCARKEAVEKAHSPKNAASALDKAVELVELGGVIRVRRDVFATVSTDGTETYLTTRTACTCSAGLAGRHRCHHQDAVVLLTGTGQDAPRVFALPSPIALAA